MAAPVWRACFFRHFRDAKAIQQSSVVCQVFKNEQERFRLQTRCLAYQQPSGRKSFFDRVLDNIKQEKDKHKEIEEGVKKLQEQADDALKSDKVQSAWKAYQSAGTEAAKATGVVVEKIQSALKDVQKTDVVKKFSGFTDTLGQTAKEAADSVAKHGDKISESSAFKAVTKSIDTIQKEIGQDHATGYCPPKVLRKRTETHYHEGEEKPVEPNLEVEDVILHKDSVWSEGWRKMKENNPIFDKVFDLKAKYDESDNVAIRASRAITDRVTSLFGGMFSQSELSEVMTEIVKMDPSFTREKFLHDCQFDIIPNILESVVRSDLEVLEDWCSEAPYSMLSQPIKQWAQQGHMHVCKILDLCNVDILLGKIMDPGPVLVISFQTQQIEAVVDKKGKVVEGDLEKVMRVSYVWALCRDQTELDPKAAWRLMEASVQNISEQWM